MPTTLRLLLLRLHDERAASLVEYALLVALIALACIGAMTFLGTQTSDNINVSGSSLFNPN
jgi:pilus assembly protein Flp/PilA